MNRITIFFNIISLFFLSTLISATISAPVQASAIEHIYEVSLPVVSQDKQVRGAAFEKGLIEVAVRVSGNSLAPTQLDLKQATRMVSKYRYTVMSQEEIEAYLKKTKTLIAPKFTLWMQFDAGKVKKILRDNALPIWGYQRPNVLIWLAVKDGRNRYILKKSDISQIKDALELEAKRRGLPILWPEFDARDQNIVSFIDIWGAFLEPVKQASQRYPVDAIVIGRMNWTQGAWSADWSLLMDNKTQNWRLSATDLGILMGSGIGVATDQISSRFAVFADSANDGELLLRISDLSNVSQYAKAAHYLQSLAPVKNVYAAEVNQQQVDFHIELSGDESDLKRIIALGKVLVPDTEPVTDNSAKSDPVPSDQISSEQNKGNMSPSPANQSPVNQSKNILRYKLNG